MNSFFTQRRPWRRLRSFVNSGWDIACVASVPVRVERKKEFSFFALFPARTFCSRPISARPVWESSFSRPYISYGSYGNACYASNWDMDART